MGAKSTGWDPPASRGYFEKNALSLPAPFVHNHSPKSKVQGPRSEVFGSYPLAPIPQPPPMPRYRIAIAYDGAAYFGWQRQPEHPGIQQVLEEALEPFVTRHRKPNPEESDPTTTPAVVVVGSGRTDAGVHARRQIAHFDLDRDIRPISILRALNATLPEDIRIMEAEVAPPDFHAQFSAHGKEYRYFLWNAEVMPPERRRYAAHVRNPLDLDAMRDAASRFVGEHDFAAFTVNPHRVVRTTVRTVYAIDIVVSEEGRLVEFRVRGGGFLYKMVRSIVGFLIAVGLGRERPEAVDEVLASKVRTARVESAPPQGLFLWDVWYE